MLRKWKKWLPTVLFVLLLGAVCWYLYSSREELAGLMKLDAGTVAIMLLVGLGSCIMNCVYHKVILDTHRLDLDLVDWMGVVAVANIIALVVPMRADLLFTANYYKRTKGLAYTKSASLAAGNVVFGIVFAVLQMFAALLCTGLIEHTWPPVLWAAWGAGTLCTAGFIAFSLIFQDHMPAKVRRIRIVCDVVEGFNALLRNGALLWRLLICLILNNLFHLLLYVVCFRAIGINVTVYQALFYNSISRLCNIVAIVPGNIGIKEAIMGVAGSLMGDVFSQSVVVSLMHTAVQILSGLILGLVFAWPVWNRWSAAVAAHDAEKQAGKPV